jgi:hypothetical protein
MVTAWVRMRQPPITHRGHQEPTRRATTCSASGLHPDLTPRLDNHVPASYTTSHPKYTATFKQKSDSSFSGSTDVATSWLARI